MIDTFLHLVVKWRIENEFCGNKSSNRGIEILCSKTYCLFTKVTNINASPTVPLLNPNTVGLSIENPSRDRLTNVLSDLCQSC